MWRNFVAIYDEMQCNEIECESRSRMLFSAKWRWRNGCLWETSTAIQASGSEKRNRPKLLMAIHLDTLQTNGGCCAGNKCTYNQRQRNWMTMHNQKLIRFYLSCTHFDVMAFWVGWVETERRVVICRLHLHLVVWAFWFFKHEHIIDACERRKSNNNNNNHRHIHQTELVQFTTMY